MKANGLAFLQASSVIQYIYDHCDFVTLEKLSEKFSFNQSYLGRMIKENSKVGFRDLLKEIVQAYFQALGNGKKVLFLALGSIFIIRLPLIIVGKVIGNITAIWWILVLSDWMIAAWAAGIYIKGKKEYWRGKLNKE